MNRFELRGKRQIPGTLRLILGFISVAFYLWQLHLIAFTGADNTKLYTGELCQKSTTLYKNKDHRL